MVNVLRVTGTRSLLENEEKFKKEAQNINNVDIDFLCYLDIYYDGKFRYIKNWEELKDYDLFWVGWMRWISMKQWLLYYFGHLQKKKLVDTFSLYKLDNTKFLQLLFANHFWFRVPQSIFFVIEKLNEQKHISILENSLQYPFIAKNIAKDRWEWVFMVNNREELINLLNTNQLYGFIFQEFIKNDGDIRVIVIWNKVIGAMKRYDPRWWFKNNISSGWIWEKFEVSKKLKELCIDISQKYELGISWLDFFIDGDEYLLIEINDLPQHKWIEKYTNINFSKEVLEYFSTLW